MCSRTADGHMLSAYKMAVVAQIVEMKAGTKKFEVGVL